MQPQAKSVLFKLAVPLDASCRSQEEFSRKFHRVLLGGWQEHCEPLFGLRIGQECLWNIEPIETLGRERISICISVPIRGPYMPHALAHRTEQISALNTASRSLSRWRASSSLVTCNLMSVNNSPSILSIEMNGRPERSRMILTCKGRLVTKSRT